MPINNQVINIYFNVLGACWPKHWARRFPFEGSRMAKIPEDKVEARKEEKEVITWRSCHDAVPLRDTNDSCMWSQHHWQAFADNSRNKDLADGRSGLWLSFSITTWQWSNPTRQCGPIHRGRALFTMCGDAAMEDVCSSCGEQLWVSLCVITSARFVKVQKSVGVYHVAPFGATTQGAGASAQQRDASQRTKEKRARA